MKESTFHKSVETAISQSLQTKKNLLVLVSPADSQSDELLWADRLVNLSQSENLIKESFVPLEVTGGTQEYQFFSQIFPVNNIPSIFIINQSIIVDRFDGPISVDDFLERLSRANGDSVDDGIGGLSSEEDTPSETGGSNTPNEENTGVVSEPTNRNVNTPATTVSTTHTVTPIDPSTPTPAPPTTPVSPHSSTTPKPITRSTSPKKHRESNSASSIPHSTTPSSGLSDTQRYQLEMKKQRQAEVDERNRILRLLQTDREERRVQRLQHQQELQESSASSSGNSIQPHKKQTRALSLSQSNQCALVIRLFDGQALKNIFTNTDSLETVRKWVDENRSDSNNPYQFFQTFPKRSFGPGEETNSLLELGLCPSSTLILKPAQNVLNAYSSSMPSSYSPSALLNVGARTLTGALYTFLGIGYKPSPPLQSSASSPPSSPSSSSSSTVKAASSSTHSHVSGHSTPLSTSGASTPSITRTTLDTRPVSSSIPSSPPSSMPNIETPIPVHSLPASTAFALSPREDLHASKPNSINSSRSSSALNIRTLHDNDDPSKDDRLTYNGNQLNLEDDNNN